MKINLSLIIARYTAKMHSRSRTPTKRLAIQGFTLVELSIVVAILSIVMTAGLEIAGQYLGDRANAQTQTQLTKLDQVLDQFYKAYGRLPCPARLDLSPLDASTNYGKEDCSLNGPAATVSPGAVPFRTLNIPQSIAIDPWGNKIGYFVTKDLTNPTGVDTASAAAGAIIVRSGKLNGVESKVLAPDAAYFLVSHGADKRGASTKTGALSAQPCVSSVADIRIDLQNCIYTYGGTATAAYPANVFYDSFFKDGIVAANYFDDIVIWRQRGQL